MNFVSKIFYNFTKLMWICWKKHSFTRIFRENYIFFSPKLAFTSTSVCVTFAWILLRSRSAKGHILFFCSSKNYWCTESTEYSVIKFKAALNYLESFWSSVSPYSARMRENTDQNNFSSNTNIQPECGKRRIRITPNTDPFTADPEITILVFLFTN